MIFAAERNFFQNSRKLKYFELAQGLCLNEKKNKIISISFNEISLEV
jgi:hypothetical protein